MPVIYIDVLLLLNLWVDFLILSATARLRHIAVKRWRLLLGAALGAVGSCLLFLPPLSVAASLIVRVSGTVLLCFAAFPYRNFRCFLGHFTTFAVLSVLFSGMASLLWYYVSPQGFLVINGVVYYDAPASLLIVFTAVSYVVVCLFDRLVRRKMPHGRRYTLTLQNGGKQLVCSCLYDTGCTLREPFSGKAAVVIDASAAKRVLPATWVEEAESGAPGLRFVPYTSLNGEGLLPAFLPEYMAVTDERGQKRDISGCYLAVSDALGNGEYTALIGTDIGDLFHE